MFDVGQKRAIITGGGSGIGLATAARLATAGADVVVIDRDDASAVAADVGATAVRADVTDESALAAAINEATTLLGGLDLLVNNAGIAVEAPIDAVADEQMRRSFDVNALGVLYGIRHATRHMTSGSSIVNIASLAGLSAFPGYAAYCAAKSAAVAITRVAAIEYGPIGIRVNCICPSSVQTPMLTEQPSGEAEARVVRAAAPLGRIVQPEEIAALVHFLAADDCTAISGVALPVDGGISAGTSIAVATTLAGNLA